MKLSETLKLKEKNIISIVGAGGKTTMMFTLGNELRKNHKILITTTTKIFVPSPDQYDFLCTNKEEFSQTIKENKNGIYVFGSRISSENKIIGLEESELDQLIQEFDYVIIEADGSKRKPLKGWNETEPVIYKKTSQTIAVLDISALAIEIQESNIHRIEKFCEISGGKIGEKVNQQHLINMINHENGLFKNAIGEKILFINKTESQKSIENANKLIAKLKQKEKTQIEKYIVASLKNKRYKVNNEEI